MWYSIVILDGDNDEICGKQDLSNKKEAKMQAIDALTDTEYIQAGMDSVKVLDGNKECVEHYFV